MFTILSIKDAYLSFLIEKDLQGCCYGFCLTWLGDILKQRPEQRSRLSRWLTSPERPQNKAIIPSNPVQLTHYFERSLRKQINYAKRCEIGKQHSTANCQVAIINYKNWHQIEKQNITGIPGLQYRTYKRCDFMLFTGLDCYGTGYPLTGVMIMFSFKLDAGVTGQHVVAAFRWGECDTYFLDPNFGLFKSVSKYPMQEIVHFIKSKYPDACGRREITISRQI